MASDANRQELEAKVLALVESKFGGDYKKAFGHYDANSDGTISVDELKTLLTDAGIGNMFTRGVWAAGIIAELDANNDGHISWAEFEAVFSAS